MALSVGILGLPNVGKSTLFKILTDNQVDISNYPFCTVEPNVGVVEVPDKRLVKLAGVIKPQKIVPAAIKFIDVAGLVKGAHKGEGLGNQFLAHLRECDILLEVVRGFKNENIAHIDGEINPKKDIEIIGEELFLKDLETIEKRLEKIEKDTKQGRKEAIEEKIVLGKLKEDLSQKKDILTEDEKKKTAHLFLLTQKLLIYVFNCRGRENLEENSLTFDFKEEEEKKYFTEEERKELGVEKNSIDELIKKCYSFLNLITFFTVAGGKEVRAWPIARGSSIMKGAGMVHTDFAERFVRAEVVNWKDLIEKGSWGACAQDGILKTVSRDYVLEDGDVIEIKV